MTNYLDRKGVPDALGLDPTDVPRQDGVQLAADDDRAELRRALLVYGTAGALGADHVRASRDVAHG